VRFVFSSPKTIKTPSNIASTRPRGATPVFAGPVVQRGFSFAEPGGLTFCFSVFNFVSPAILVLGLGNGNKLFAILL
jgi:hypothetical protein